MPSRPRRHPPATVTVPDRRASACQRGYDRKWRRLQFAYLSEHPLCVMCESRGCITEAVLVDHVTPIVAGGAVLDRANLQSLCVRCHAIKSGRDLSSRRSGCA
jgi:5-methylcytosine-specific restriction enzyme A